MAATTPTITVSYGRIERQFPICVRPSLELSDAEVDREEERLCSALKRAFSLPDGVRVTVYDTVSDRSLSKETFRDPSNLAHFPKYWYLKVDNGITTSVSERDQQVCIAVCIYVVCTRFVAPPCESFVFAFFGFLCKQWLLFGVRYVMTL